MKMHHEWLGLITIALSTGCQAPEMTGFTASVSHGSGSNSDDDDDDDNDDDDDDDSASESTLGTSSSTPDDDDDDDDNSIGGTTARPPRLDVAAMTTLEGGLTTESCADANVVITPGEATVMLLIDRSGSMTSALGTDGRNRWQGVYDVLFDPTSGIVGTYEDEVQFGVTFYTNLQDGGECPDLEIVDPAYNNGAAMEAAYNAITIGQGDTPTGESLLAVAQRLSGINDGTTKAIVLATDGDPDTCAVPNGNPTPLKGETVLAADTVVNMGIPIFVIGMLNPGTDPGLDVNHLQDLANVGVGAAHYYDDPALNNESNEIDGEDWVDTRAPANPGTLYTASNVEELGYAFGALLSNFVPCDFTLNGTVVVSQACRGQVTIDGQVLECGVDWEVTDASTLTLLPPACALLQDGQDHDVSANFPCEIFVEG